MDGGLKACWGPLPHAVGQGGLTADCPADQRLPSQPHSAQTVRRARTQPTAGRSQSGRAADAGVAPGPVARCHQPRGLALSSPRGPPPRTARLRRRANQPSTLQQQEGAPGAPPGDQAAVAAAPMSADPSSGGLAAAAAVAEGSGVAPPPAAAADDSLSRLPPQAQGSGLADPLPRAQNSSLTEEDEDEVVEQDPTGAHCAARP